MHMHGESSWLHSIKVYLTMSGKSGSAPACRSEFSASSCPPMAARKRGVRPNWDPQFKTRQRPSNSACVDAARVLKIIQTELCAAVLVGSLHL